MYARSYQSVLLLVEETTERLVERCFTNPKSHKRQPLINPLILKRDLRCNCCLLPVGSGPGQASSRSVRRQPDIAIIKENLISR